MLDNTDVVNETPETVYPEAPHAPADPVAVLDDGADGADVAAELTQTHDDTRTAVKNVEDIPSEKVQYVTPQDTIDALRLISKKKLVEVGDDQETKAHIRNLVVEWITQKRAGITNQDWETWVSTPDQTTDDDEGSEDPTN